MGEIEEQAFECIGGPLDGEFVGWPPEGYHCTCSARVSKDGKVITMTYACIHSSLPPEAVNWIQPQVAE